MFKISLSNLGCLSACWGDVQSQMLCQKIIPHSALVNNVIFTVCRYWEPLWNWICPNYTTSHNGDFMRILCVLEHLSTENPIWASDTPIKQSWRTVIELSVQKCPDLYTCSVISWCGLSDLLRFSLQFQHLIWARWGSFSNCCSLVRRALRLLMANSVDLIRVQKNYSGLF